MGNWERTFWTEDNKMIIIFLIIILLLNNIYANNQAIGYFIKNDYLGGKVVGLIVPIPTPIPSSKI